MDNSQFVTVQRMRKEREKMCLYLQRHIIDMKEISKHGRGGVF